MNRIWKTALLLVGLGCLWVAGCNAATPLPTPLLQTPTTVVATLTATRIPGYSTPVKDKNLPRSDSEEETATVTPRPTKTPTPTNTPFIYSGLPTLLELVINENDFRSEKYSFKQNLQFYFMIDDSEPINITDEISEKCKFDCVQVYWGFRQLTLTMVRYPNSEYAFEALVDGWEAYLQDENRYDECHALKGLNDNHWTVILNPEPLHIIYQLSAVQGQFLYTLVAPYKIEGIDWESGYYCEPLEYFSDIQSQKILNAVFITP